MIRQYFRYREPNGPLVRLPLLPVSIRYKQKEVPVFALVDSGSDLSIFPASLTKTLGIDMKAGKPEEICAISGDPFEMYVHQVHLTVIGLSSVDILVGFTESEGVGSGLLGQRGFFDNYMVRFERYRDQLEVFPRSTAF